MKNPFAWIYELITSNITVIEEVKPDWKEIDWSKVETVKDIKDIIKAQYPRIDVDINYKHGKPIAHLCKDKED